MRTVSGGEAGVRPTIVIVDDAAEVRALVRTRLRLSQRLDVVAEAADGAEAVAAAREHRPDLMLLDVSMPVMDGLESLPRVLEASPGTRVAMYSGFQEEGLAQRARELGAAAFLEKSTALETLVDALLELIPAQHGSASEHVAPADPPDESDRKVLREHLERFREVFEDAAIGMATVTLAGQVVRANRALAGILERPVERLVGASYADFTDGHGELVTDALEQILTGTTRAVQLEHVVTGSTRHVRATLAPVLDSAGRPLYLFVQVQDVTAQRGAEEELRRSEVRFKLLVENVEDYAIFMLSPEGFVESWNSGAQRIKGYTEKEIVGQHFRVFYPRELQESRHPEHELEIAIREGHYEEEGWRIRKDGSRFWANVLITAVRDQDGRHIGFAKVTRDNTERRAMLEERERAAAALAEANARLQQAAEDQAHFLAVTAHELRTPVGVLSGTADILAAHWAELDDEERGQLLDGLASSAGRLRRLLADLLTASRLQNSALELELGPVDVAQVVASSVLAARSSHAGVDVTVESEPGLLVEGDQDRLAQAVDNLIGNAVRHGVPPVRITVRPVGDEVEIVVVDAGPGVSEEMRERLFGRFSTGRAGGGTGLGLYIVRQLARSHGGEATYRPPAADEPGSGGFVITLPRAGAGARVPPLAPTL